MIDLVVPTLNPVVFCNDEHSDWLLEDMFASKHILPDVQPIRHSIDFLRTASTKMIIGESEPCFQMVDGTELALRVLGRRVYEPWMSHYIATILASFPLSLYKGKPTHCGCYHYDAETNVLLDYGGLLMYLACTGKIDLNTTTLTEITVCATHTLLNDPIIIPTTQEHLLFPVMLRDEFDCELYSDPMVDELSGLLLVCLKRLVCAP